MPSRLPFNEDQKELIKLIEIEVSELEEILKTRASKKKMSHLE